MSGRHILFLMLGLIGCLPASARASDPNALWRIIHTECVPHQQMFHRPLPCAEVDQPGGYAVLKDIKGATQFLLIPTAHVTGIEDPAVLAAGAPNYWQAAWEARSLVQASAKRPLADDSLSLAINSIDGRSQNQLHIHIDCVRPDVRDAVRQHLGDIGRNWGAFPVRLAGHAYRAMRVDTLDRPGADPFQLLADGVPGARADMRHQALVAVGAVFEDGFPGLVVLQTQVDLANGNRGEGEELQDHTCALGQAE